MIFIISTGKGKSFMNYDRIIIELMDKISSLEERVELLETELVVTNDGSDKEIEKMNRSFTKDDVINEIKEKLSRYNITIRKGSNAEGGGLFLTNEKGEQRRALLKLSRDYVPTNPKKFEGFQWRGWHRVSRESASVFDYYIFSIEHDGELDFFIIDQKHYIELTKDKMTDKNDNYYFYFVEDQRGNIYEDRDEVNDMRPYFNNWEKFKYM